MATTRSTKHPFPLRQFRKFARLTQFELVHKSGVCQPRISAIENGHVTPSPRELRALTRALGIPAGLFTDGPGDES
ncbi:MAG: helix-turn-helix transcriptional regulator [Candidatus Aminicenantales bacterium]|jgi:transcriptional regulator with XRE-family HTH domain